MTKPHEETWTLDEEAVAAGDFSAIDSRGHFVLTTYSSGAEHIGDAEALARLKLASASPDIARALLDYFRNGDSPARRAAAADALKKAGVL